MTSGTAGSLPGRILRIDGADAQRLALILRRDEGQGLDVSIGTVRCFDAGGSARSPGEFTVLG